MEEKMKVKSTLQNLNSRLRKIKIDRRVILAASLVGVLLVVAVINAVLNRESSANNSQAPNAAAAFAAYRAERNLTRQREVEYLDSIIQNTETQKEVLSRAQEQKLQLVSNMEAEVTIETVLKTKGLTDTVVAVKPDAISVMVNLPVLSTSQVAQVVEIVCENTTLAPAQIKIIPAA